MSNETITHCMVLSGGVGGAKLVEGLYRAPTFLRLGVIANTGDDFDHLGLRICPDIDTLVYTLAGLANPDTGWGLQDETWQFMDALERLGGETWFRLGDRDLATHVRRTQLLGEGAMLSAITSELCERAGVDPNTEIIPMSEQPAPTRVVTDTGELDFQQYFVREQCGPTVKALCYGTGPRTPAAPAALAALADPELRAILVTPSNPWLSIDPILAVSDIERLMREHPAPVVAISPIVGGSAIKGPTAKIMKELGAEVSALGIAQHYEGLIDGLVIDEQDAQQEKSINALGIATLCTNTIMRTLEDKVRLAQQSLAFSAELAADRR